MKTIVFLDIDGVLSIPNVNNYAERHERWPGVGAPWPIPMANDLLRVIDTSSRILPVWLSCWSTGGYVWNDRAGTRRWPVGYHLCKSSQTLALRRFPEYRGQDEKLLAARWFLRDHPRNPVVWIEDGFADETQAWATTRGNARLVDTWPYDGETARFLTRNYEDPAQAAKEFLERYCGIAQI